MNKITQELLGIVSDWNGVFDGAYNIREDGQCAGRQSTEHITLENKEDAPGLVVRNFRMVNSFLLIVILCSLLSTGPPSPSFTQAAAASIRGLKKSSAAVPSTRSKPLLIKT